MDVLLLQRCAKILVGDPHQQIYTFRGAVNALNIVDHTHIYYLTQVHASIHTRRGCYSLSMMPHTSFELIRMNHLPVAQSFRFGAEIAYVGATILQVCKKVQKILVGGKQKGEVLCI